MKHLPPTLLLALLTLSTSTWALKQGGERIAGEGGCNGCHRAPSVDSQPPTVSVTANPTAASPGQTVTLTVTVETKHGTGAGFYLKPVGEGVLQRTSDPGVTVLGSGGAVHTDRRDGSGPVVSFQLGFAVPQTSTGATDFQVWGLSANANGSSSGDMGNTQPAVASVVWGCSGVPYYVDGDADGFGTSAFASVLRCGPSPGYAPAAGDCDDNDENKKPGVPETCNKADDDCDGQIDEGLSGSFTFYPDADGDGYGVPGQTSTGTGCQPPAGYSVTANDCNDASANVNPGAQEVCNGRDEDCDGRTDEGTNVPTCGVGMCRRLAPACRMELCVEGTPAPEQCNGVDDDCDDQIDEGNPCGTGKACVEGRCETGAPSPSGDEQGETPGTSSPADKPASGCQTVTGATAWLGLLGAWALFQRRRRD